MKKIYKIIIGVGIGSVVLLYVFLANNSYVSAQAADAVLRPILGSQKTIFIESLYFNGIDKVSGITYHVTSHAESLLTQASQLANAQGLTKNVDSMDLTPLTNQALSPVAGEGIWQPISQNLFLNQEVIAQTTFRSDKDRPYAVVYLVKMDMKKLGIGLQGGTYYPGGVRHVYGSGIVPTPIQKSNILVAAFNGGFQEKDGEYGMTIGKNVYVPLRTHLPALLLFADGSVQFVTYQGQQLASSVVATRQNGPFLIENGRITSFVESGTDSWGRTITNSMYTWRSGIGITKKGNLVYAVGNSLIPQTLAKALLAAGAANAIQLDINSPWVRFIVYQSLGNARYSYTPLLRDMQGGYEYLNGYNKDFFYLYKK